MAYVYKYFVSIVVDLQVKFCEFVNVLISNIF